jgi:hypothetical protein
MKIHLRADEANGEHTKVTVFMNGANCGQLTMREDEAIFFHEVILQSNYRIPGDEMYSSGIWTKENK